MKTVILGDLHNRLDKTRDLFDQIGLIEINSGDPFTDKRNEGFHVIQAGDALSLGYGEKEANFYRYLFDIVGVEEALLGNHELPSVYHSPDKVMFNGYNDRAEIAGMGATGEYWAAHYVWETGRDREAEQLVRDAFKEGRYKVATSVGDWLVTHAGLAARYERLHDLKDKSAAEVADALNAFWDDAVENGSVHEVIANTSEHGGGVMWLRFDYLRNGYNESGKGRRLKQIVGHTGYYGPKLYGDSLWCIDTPAPSKQAGGRTEKGGVAALVTEDAGENFELFYVE